MCTPAIKYFRIFWCIQSFVFQHVIFLILNKISLLCKLTMFLEIEKEVGVERRPPPTPPPKGSFWRIFLLYKQNYISSVGQVFDMLNNLHIWVFVKWELKELKIGVKESQVPGIWKKFRIKELLPLLVISKKPHSRVSQKPGKEEPCRFLGNYFTFTIWDLGFKTSTDRLLKKSPATSPASPFPHPPKTSVTNRHTYWIYIYDICVCMSADRLTEFIYMCVCQQWVNTKHVKKEIERAFFTTRKWFVVGLAYQLPRQGYCVCLDSL